MREVAAQLVHSQIISRRDEQWQTVHVRFLGQIKKIKNDKMYFGG